MKFIIRFQNSRLNQLWGSQRKAITLEAGTGKPFKYFWLFAVKTLQKWSIETRLHILNSGCLAAAAAAKSLQSCPTLCDPRDGSPPASPVPGILQARTMEWATISFSNASKWKVKVKSLRRVRLLATPWTAAYQAPPSMGFSRQEYWSGVPLPSPLDALCAFKNISTYQILGF